MKAKIEQRKFFLQKQNYKPITQLTATPPFPTPQLLAQISSKA
jgi:hypothetical protein